MELSQPPKVRRLDPDTKLRVVGEPVAMPPLDSPFGAQDGHAPGNGHALPNGNGNGNGALNGNGTAAATAGARPSPR